MAFTVSVSPVIATAAASSTVAVTLTGCTSRKAIIGAVIWNVNATNISGVTATGESAGVLVGTHPQTVGANGSQSAQIFYFRNTVGTGSKTITATFSGTAPTALIVAMEVSGADLAALIDPNASSHQEVAGTTSASPAGSVTTDTANTMLFGVIFGGTSGAPTKPTGWTQVSIDTTATGAGLAHAQAGYLLDAGAAGAHNFNWTFGATDIFSEVTFALRLPTIATIIGTPAYANPVTSNQFTAGYTAISSNHTSNWIANPATATTAWINVGATGTANTCKICVYDNTGHLLGVSAAINVTSTGLKSGAINAAITSSFLGYTLVVVCDTGSFSTVSDSGTSAAADVQWLPASFSYTTPPTTIPGGDLSNTGQEFLVYLTVGGTAYNLNCATTVYTRLAEATSLIQVGATHTYVMPAAAVMFDRLLGVSTSDQILNVSKLAFSRSVSDAQFLPHGGLLSVSGVSFHGSVGSALFVYVPGVTVAAAANCSFDFANYAAFRTSVQQLMDGDDISTSAMSVGILDLIIATGERRLYRDVRSSAQDTALTLTVTNNSAPMPIDLIELRSVYLANGVPLIYMPYEQFQERLQLSSASTRKPYYYTFEGDSIIFYPSQADGTVINGRYYKRFCSIVTEGLAGNTYFARFPDLWTYAALLESAPFIGESTRMPVWEQRYQEIVLSVQKYERRRYTQGSKLSMRVS